MNPERYQNYSTKECFFNIINTYLLLNSLFFPKARADEFFSHHSSKEQGTLGRHD